MASAPLRLQRPLTHPAHIVLVVSPLPLFLGALLSDWAYTTSYQVQWINFASWLIAGALVLLGAALLWTFVQALISHGPQRRAFWILFGMATVTFAVGFINALQHAKDAGATMPAGIILSVIVFILMAISVSYGFVANRPGDQT